MSLKFSHLWLYVKDTGQSLRFYDEVLGFKIVSRFPDGGLVDAGGVLIGLHPELRDQKSHHRGNTIILKTDNVERSMKELLREVPNSSPRLGERTMVSSPTSGTLMGIL